MRTGDRPALSLIETLVVIAIVLTLLGITLPAIQRARDSGNRAVCREHLKQIGMALIHYHDNRGSLPPGVSYMNGTDPHPHMAWCTRLLPFIQHETLWQQTMNAFAMEPFFRKNPPHIGLSTRIPVYTCPADSRAQKLVEFGSLKVGLTSYLGVQGTNQRNKDGLLYLDSKVRFAEISDGASNTLLVGERPPSANLVFGWWYAGWGQAKDGSAESILGVREWNVWFKEGECPPGPYEYGPGTFNNMCDTFHFWSPHVSSGAHFLLADGSVRFLPYAANHAMPALATRAGGETISFPY